MKRIQKATALTLIFTAFGMAGSAMAAPYHKAQIKRVPKLTHHLGRGYGAARQGWSPNPIRRTEPQSWGRRQGSQSHRHPNPQGWVRVSHTGVNPCPP